MLPTGCYDIKPVEVRCEIGHRHRSSPLRESNGRHTLKERMLCQRSKRGKTDLKLLSQSRIYKLMHFGRVTQSQSSSISRVLAMCTARVALQDTHVQLLLAPVHVTRFLAHALDSTPHYRSPFRCTPGIGSHVAIQGVCDCLWPSRGLLSAGSGAPATPEARLLQGPRFP